MVVKQYFITRATIYGWVGGERTQTVGRFGRMSERLTVAAFQNLVALTGCVIKVLLKFARR